ncbi:hypothetical protein M407DRAFT_21153 [Tulasnella calospora MUT 4182]|uniref:Uncharacterized protein n=1 Tax=Tulasnella calospora MUT 4182 TaxID=1051891 RepID=A0A0C3L788_9AGAM|nr:hypothetical protein M407DRAFT_21153 [Tulasnella calospora MUT 4182]
MATVQYGTELPDQVEVLNKVLENQLSLISDVRDLIRERAALEKEYAQKLQAIARKASEKRSRTAAARIVGEDPAKAFGDDAIRRNTLESAFAMLIEAYDTSAQDHASFGEALSAQVSQDLKNLEQKKDGTRKKYDEECLEIESYRQKQSRAADDKHADRAAKQYDSQKAEMQNSKNTFIVSIAVANKAKDTFYHVDLPALENQFQEIQASLTASLTRILRSHQHLQSTALEGLKYKMTLVDNSLSAFDAAKDQALFVEYNKRAGFSVPGDWDWEPCAGFYETGVISVEPTPKVYLQNKLAKAQSKLDEVRALEKTKERDANQLRQLVSSYQANPKLGDVDDVMNDYLDAAHTHMQWRAIGLALEAEMATILGALGDDTGAQQPHNFKSSSFSIPTPCGFCKSSIWGLSKQGKTCKACGLSVHAKCELKVPAECSGATGGRRAPPARNVPSTMREGGNAIPMRQVSGHGAGSALSVTVPEGKVSTPTPSAFNLPSASAFNQPAFPRATIMFDFVASSPFEMNVVEGQAVEVVEEDDGSGWIKVGNPRSGEKGLVPASYVQMDGAHEDASAPPPTVNRGSRPQGSGKFVKGVYEYTAQGDDEISVQVGRRIELTAAGMSYGDGWAEGIDESGKKGIFPSNYVEPM